MKRPGHHRREIEADRLREAVAELLCEARAKGMRIVDGCVNSRDAACLIRLSRFTIRNWRDGRDPVEHQKPKGRHLYPLIALARHQLETNDRARLEAAEVYGNALDTSEQARDDMLVFRKRASK